MSGKCYLAKWLPPVTSSFKCGAGKNEKKTLKMIKLVALSSYDETNL